MESLSIIIPSQYVRLTQVKENIRGQSHALHEVQRKLKEDFQQLPEFTIITAPTGTGKSYAFPFPVLNSKENEDFYDRTKTRGLIVLPTNALINELYENFKNSYPQLQIEKITGTTLNEWQLKGFNRWEKILKVTESCDLTISNPDIINYAMHGGYHMRHWKKGMAGGTEFHQFLSHFQYIIFDEYHLYDEAQIANLLTLVFLREIFLRENNRIKYIFASATPEEGLKEYLNEKDIYFEEIVEKIKGDSHNARAIHGELNVKFHGAGATVRQLIYDKEEEIKAELEKGRRVLLILNRLREVQELAEELIMKFPEYNVYQSTGYIDKKQNQFQSLKAANIIVATSKAEVGVNYEVEYCIMEPGKHFQNFVQRFGRVSRGDKEGQIHIVVTSFTLNQLKKHFNDGQSVPYYDFVDGTKQVLQSRKFYEESIPSYIGEYIWCIRQQIRKQNYNSFKVLDERLNQLMFFGNSKVYSRYKVFQDIDRQLYIMKKNYPNGPIVKEWLKWWDVYLSTFLNFRDASLVVRIVDKHENLELDYSLDWILQNKDIICIEEEINEGKHIKTYYVGKIKERDNDIQYHVATLPHVEMHGNSFVSYSDIANVGFRWDLLFTLAVSNIEKKVKKEVGNFAEQKLSLLQKIKPLAFTFNQKRLVISDIVGNDVIL